MTQYVDKFKMSSGTYLFKDSEGRKLIEQNKQEIDDTVNRINKELENLLQVKAEVFAYPCGQKFVGRGKATKSYVPVVADLFLLGRGWKDEAPNDPRYGNFAQLTGMEMDGKNFDEILTLIRDASEKGLWLVLAGHEMGESGEQTTRLSMLKELMEYAKDPTNGIWIAPMGTVAKYINQQSN